MDLFEASELAGVIRQEYPQAMITIAQARGGGWVIILTFPDDYEISIKNRADWESLKVMLTGEV